MKKPLTSMPQLLWICAAVLFLCFLAIVLWFAYRGALPPLFAQNDKPAHSILYGIATFLGHRALNRRQIRLGSRLLPLFPCLFALFTLAEELAQYFSPNRTLDPLDLLASFIGIAIGYRLAR